MRTYTISPQLQQVLAVGVPILALVISLVVVYPAWGRYGDAKKEVEALRQDLKDIEATPLPPRDPVVPAVDEGQRESALFLGQIVALSLAPQCRFVGMENRPATATAAGPLLRSVRSKVEVEGSYPQVRRFLAQVRNSPRLFVIAGVDVNVRTTVSPTGVVNTSAPGVRAAVDIERYVIPATAPSMAEGTGVVPAAGVPPSQGTGQNVAQSAAPASSAAQGRR